MAVLWHFDMDTERAKFYFYTRYGLDEFITLNDI